MLESAGIFCFVQDESASTLLNNYSQAIGGIKLQVMEKDFEEAKELLISGGYTFNAANQEEELDEQLRSIDQITSQIPIIGKLTLGYRLIALIIILAILLYTFFVSLPSYIH